MRTIANVHGLIGVVPDIIDGEIVGQKIADLDARYTFESVTLAIKSFQISWAQITEIEVINDQPTDGSTITIQGTVLGEERVLGYITKIVINEPIRNSPEHF